MTASRHWPQYQKQAETKLRSLHILVKTSPMSSIMAWFVRYRSRRLTSHIASLGGEGSLDDLILFKRCIYKSLSIWLPGAPGPHARLQYLLW